MADQNREKDAVTSPGTGGRKPSRRRVSRACDRCKSRKTRCSGKWPCAFCSNLGKQCNFTAIYRRGRLPSVEIDSETAHSQPNAAPVPAGKCHSPAENQARIDNVSIVIPEGRRGGHDSSNDDYKTSLLDATTPPETPNGPSSATHNAVNSICNNNGNSNNTPTLRVAATSTSVSQSMRNTPEPSQRDQQGHYVGPASGVSFLLRIQRKLAAAQQSSVSSSSIFTFGDNPLPELFNQQPFAILPAREEAKNMVNRYFDFAIATHRFVHRPTIESWLEELYATNGQMIPEDSSSADDNSNSSNKSRIALLFMIFAHANLFRDGDCCQSRAAAAAASGGGGGGGSSAATAASAASEAAETISARYFSVAEHQLSAETGRIRLTSIQARLAQCFYLLAQSRLNHCWTLFGTTVHLVFALGIHRKTYIDHNQSHKNNNNNIDYLDLELRKRTFWCTYNLSMYLSAALGRPMAFHHDDFDQEIPSSVDDNLIRKNSPPPVSLRGHAQRSIMSAPVAHWRLSKIQASLLREFYGIKPPSSTDRLCYLASRYTSALDAWRKDIAYLLDGSEYDDDDDDDDDQEVGGGGIGGQSSSAFFLQIVIRQRDVLRLAFYHARILVYRPFLLRSFASLNNNNNNGGGGGGGGGKYNLGNGNREREREMRENVQRCLDAALGMVRLVDRMRGRGKMYSTFFFIPYFAFSAAAVLYVHAIQQRQDGNGGGGHGNGMKDEKDVLVYFKAARTCQKQLESMATVNSLPQRYGVVLEELQLEVRRHNKYLAAVLMEEEEGARSTVLGGIPQGNRKTQRSVDFLVDIDDDNDGGGSVGQQQQQERGVTATTGKRLNEMDMNGMIDDGQPLGGSAGNVGDEASSSYDSFLQILGGGGADGNVPFPAGGSPEDPITQMTGWGQFDSLVTGGTGGLDALFTGTGMDGWGDGLG